MSCADLISHVLVPLGSGAHTFLKCPYDAWYRGIHTRLLAAYVELM
jgi:hypothetical protein